MNTLNKASFVHNVASTFVDKYIYSRPHNLQKLQLMEPSMSIERLATFSDILSYPPLFGYKKEVSPKIKIYSDFDGVFNSFIGNENSINQGVDRMLTLRSLAKHTDQFTIWSSRINVSNIFDRGSRRITSFPFISPNAQERLSTFIKKANPECEVNFHLGIEKLRRNHNHKDSFMISTIKSIEAGDRVVIIGSSMFDRRGMSKIIKRAQNENIDLSQVYYFDTNHFIL